jgi:hypothetical protein
VNALRQNKDETQEPAMCCIAEFVSVCCIVAFCLLSKREDQCRWEGLSQVEVDNQSFPRPFLGPTLTSASLLHMQDNDYFGRIGLARKPASAAAS